MNVYRVFCLHLSYCQNFKKLRSFETLKKRDKEFINSLTSHSAMERAENEKKGKFSGEDGPSSVDNIVRNMALAHELVMDTNFKLNETAADSIEGQVKRIVHKAFWDSMEEDIVREPPNYTHVLRLLAELKETLLALLLEHNTSLKEQINNVLDIELITQQSQQDTVDIQGYARYIIDVMSKICTPARDEDIEKLRQVEGLVPLFREIFRVLDLMQLDMTNFRLSLFRPQLVKQSVEYEQEKFREYLKANPYGLLSAKQWIKRGLDVSEMAGNMNRKRCGQELDSEDATDALSRTPLGASSVQTESPKQSPELSEVIKHSYSGILLGEDEFPYPETLLMDKHRVAEIRRSTQSLVRVASVLVVTMNIVGKHLASDSEYKKSLKENMFILLRGIPESNLRGAFSNLREQVVKETVHFLSKRGLEALDDEKLNLLRQQVMNLADDDNSVRQLMKRRVYSFVVDNLLRPKTSSSPPLAAALSDVEPELVELTKQFAKLVSYNYAVFQPFYEQVLQELITEASSRE